MKRKGLYRVCGATQAAQVYIGRCGAICEVEAANARAAVRKVAKAAGMKCIDFYAAGGGR